MKNSYGVFGLKDNPAAKREDDDIDAYYRRLDERAAIAYDALRHAELAEARDEAKIRRLRAAYEQVGRE